MTRGFRLSSSRASSGVATSQPIASMMVRARSTSWALVAFTPRERYRLSSSPTRTCPPSRIDWATHGICIRPSANDAHCDPSGSCCTIEASRVGSAGAPYGMSMQSWNSGGASIRPSSTSCRANQRWPVSKISISHRTPSSWISLAPSRSMSGVLT